MESDRDYPDEGVAHLDMDIDGGLKRRNAGFLTPPHPPNIMMKQLIRCHLKLHNTIPTAG